MKNTLVITFILFLYWSATAQHLSSYHGKVDNAYNFWLYTPEGYVKGETAKPLIVFLHGRSLCGRDLNRVRRYGPLNALNMGMRIDAIILAPQNPGGSWKPEKVMKLVEWVEEHQTIDTNRIYVYGMSLGGYGTIDFAATYPDKVAAAMALCGGGTVKEYCGLNNLPLWILHGTADRAVGVSASQKVVDAMAECNGKEASDNRLIWTKLQGLGHGQLARIFYLPDTYNWLFSHSLADEGRPVCRSYEITPSSLSRDVYRATRQGGVVQVVQGEETVGNNDTIATQEKHPEETKKYYTIKKGDTLGAIARRHHTSVAALCRLNGIKTTTTLKIGRRIRVR